MTTQEIINRARRLCYTNSVQYNDTQALEDLNIIYNDICNSIIQEVNEWFFWDIFKTDTVVWQSEYTFPNNVLKVEEIYINYWDWYVKAINKELISLTKDAWYYEEYESKTSPFYEIKDWSIFIYPTATEITTDWVKMRAIITPVDVTISDTVVIPTEYHYIISEWMKQFIYQSRGKTNEKNDAELEYKNKKEDMLFQLTDRRNTPTNWLLPNLSYYG